MSFPDDPSALLSLLLCTENGIWPVLRGASGIGLGVHVLCMALILGALFVSVIQERQTQSDDWNAHVRLDRALQKRGAILGPLMFLTIFTGLALYWLKTESFSWDFSTDWNGLHSVKMLLFLPFWIHWAWHEVVVMDGVRKHWPKDSAEPSVTYIKGHHRVYKSLKLLFLQGLLVFGLGIAAGGPNTKSAFLKGPCAWDAYPTPTATSEVDSVTPTPTIAKDANPPTPTPTLVHGG